MRLSNKTYDVLKYIALIALPALAVFYAAISKIWPDMPYPVEIPATIMAVDTLLGELIKLSSDKYKAEQAIMEDE